MWIDSTGLRFTGNLTTFSLSDGVGASTGTGRLRFRDGATNQWKDATVGPARVTITFTGRSFSIAFSGTTVPGGPALRPAELGPASRGARSPSGDGSAHGVVVIAEVLITTTLRRGSRTT